MRRRNSARSAIALAHILTMFASDAMAEELGLDYDAPTACPDADGFRDRLASRIGRIEFDDAATRVLEVRVDGRTRFWGQVVLGTSSRRLGPSQDCGDLVDTIAATVAILLDPLGRRAAETRQAPPESQRAEVSSEVVSPEPAVLPVRQPTPPAVVPSTLPAQAARQTESPPDETIIWGPDLAFGASFGVGPSTLFDARAGLRVGGRHWHVAVRGRLRHSLVAVPLSVDVAAEVVVASYGGELEGCGKWWRLHLCGVVEFSRYGADGERTGSGDRAPFVTLGPRVAFTLPVAPRLEVSFIGDLAFLITRPRILLDAQPVWSAGSVGASVSLGFAVRLGS